ncbi:MAG: NYN domain-containing protein [bacterium]|nr:NYN domain-containing protein [bacterium]
MKKVIVAIYIDGSNTYKRLKSLDIPQKSNRFDYSAFVRHLVGDRELISKRYYVGIVKNVDRSEQAEKMVKSQQKFLNGLQNEGFKIKSGRIMYDGGSIREKGVDVKLSVDLVIGAVDNIYDTAIIISSDTDLIPAIKYVRKAKKKKVEYIGFGSTPSLGMIKESSISRMFSDIDLIQFQVKTLKFKENYTGVIIEESLRDTKILKDVLILKTKVSPVTEKHKTPWLKKWTLHTVEIKDEDSDKIAKNLMTSLEKEHNWYADYKNNKCHFIIYRDKVFKVDLTNPILYKEARQHGIGLGIPEYQVDFTPD